MRCFGKQQPYISEITLNEEKTREINILQVINQAEENKINIENLRITILSELKNVTSNLNKFNENLQDLFEETDNFKLQFTNFTDQIKSYGKIITLKKPKFRKDDVFQIARNNKIGSFDTYFHNFNFSFEIKVQTLRRGSDLSLVGKVLKKLRFHQIGIMIFFSIYKVGGPSAGSDSIIYLFHGFNYQRKSNYNLWFKFNGTPQAYVNIDFNDYQNWHKAFTTSLILNIISYL